MARARDGKKRDIIIKAAKTLFSTRGFFNSSIADIVKDTGLPVGTIYTYFTGKEEIVRTIVDEGWEDLYNRLVNCMATQLTVEERLRLLLDKFLPELFGDIEFIHILLSEAIDLTRIQEKVDQLSGLIYLLIKEHIDAKQINWDITQNSMKTALVVYFLGILNAVKLSTSTGITTPEILAFIKQTIASSLKINL